MGAETGQKERKLFRVCLVIIFIVLFGWFFWANYIEKKGITIVEREITPHNFFLGIHGGKGGQCWAVGNFGQISHSGDGGKSWKTQASGTAEELCTVSFADDQHGFVAGSRGTLLATSDGGHSWTAQSSGTKNQLLDVQALSTTEAIAVGAFGTIITTSDGGKTWNGQKLLWEKLTPLLIKEGIVELNLNAVHFVNAKVGWIVGEFGVILHTEDGGQNWISQRYGFDFPDLYGVMFRNEHTGWAVGQKGILIQTSDGGKHWAPVELGTTRQLYAISISGEHGIIVGDGIGLKTNDRGSTWRKIESMPEHIWFSSVSVMSEKAIAVGQAGAINLINIGDPKGNLSFGGK